MKPFEFDFIVKKCLENFANSFSWFSNGDLENGLEYLNKAEILLELLEVKVCGSIGGFDSFRGEFQQNNYNPRYSGSGHVMQVFTRLLWIIDHYTTIKDKDKLPYSREYKLGDLIKSLRKMYKDE